MAEVDHPFVDESGEMLSSPMSIGLFVEAEIEGRAFDKVMTLPRDALLQSNQVFTLDSSMQLQPVDVEVLYADATEAIVRSEIPAGTPVVVSHVSYASAGLPVKLRNPLPDLVAEAASTSQEN